MTNQADPTTNLARIEDLTRREFMFSALAFHRRKAGDGDDEEISVAHRPSTIALADDVLELRDGSLLPVR